jgi:hypothetical protein
VSTDCNGNGRCYCANSTRVHCTLLCRFPYVDIAGQAHFAQRSDVNRVFIPCEATSRESPTDRSKPTCDRVSSRGQWNLPVLLAYGRGESADKQEKV